ncbi:hypothetical protein V6Z11_D05G028000 [Gossypium hirsutum]
MITQALILPLDRLTLKPVEGALLCTKLYEMVWLIEIGTKRSILC